MPRVEKIFLIGAMLAATCFAHIPQAFADYPDEGPTPTPMWGTTFRYQDPLSGTPFNDDGTNSQNPVVDAGSQTLGGATYLLKKLQNTTTDAITFKGQKYTVYSAVPQNLTIDYAYKNASQYYDPKSLVDGGGTPLIDFTIPATINNGLPTDLAANQAPNAPLASDKGKTGEAVYLTKPPTDANSLYFIPNLPNSSGGHNGLTANIYFVGDPFINQKGYWPDTSNWPNGTFHLTPYGWALDPRTVAQSYTVQLLNATGGTATGITVLPSTPILVNLWKHSLQGFDMTTSDPAHPTDPTKYTVKQDLLAWLFKAINIDYTQYPFPGKNSRPQTGSYPVWLTDAGLYLHVQPTPGFQRNLLRYYTAWGAYDLYNQASDLFVRQDGTIELPAIKTDTGWRYAPIVTQTWDSSQRYSVLNLSTGTVPSTYDDYPGAEYYLPGNVYLPGKAGVVQAYVDYKVYGLTGLAARETDLWMGLKGDTANDMLFWADAPVGGKQTEPGGQANKPYMFGANTYKAPSTSAWHYSLRLQSSNSFCIARLAQDDLKGKLYDASFYADLNDSKGYQLAATISYQWQKLTIGNATAGKWVESSDALGAGVPQLIFADTLTNKVTIQAAQSSSWNDSSRTLIYSDPKNVDLKDLSKVGNVQNGPIYEYFARADTTDQNVKFLITLNERTNWIGGSGDWGTAANWSSSSVPEAANNVYLQQQDAVNRTVTYRNTAASAPLLSMLRLNAAGTGTMTLNLDSGGSAGDLQAEMLIVGAGHQGHLHQTAGTLTVDKLFLGYELAGNGTYTLEGGTLVTKNTQVGVYGTGTFNQSGGTHTISDTLTLSSNSGSIGTYNLSGGSHSAGTVNLNDGGIFNQTGGTFNFTTFNQSGGTATFTGVDLSIGPNQTYNLSGGSHSAGTINLDTGGIFNQTGGTFNFTAFNQSGGTATFTGVDLSIGPNQTYNLSGGSHSAGTINLDTGGIFSQTGGTFNFTAFNQSGGTATFTGVDLSIGPNQTYNLSGGNHSAGTINLDTGGIFSQTGGTFNFTSFNQSGGTATFTGVDLSIGPNQAYNLSGGIFSAGIINLNTGGTFNQTGGTLNYNTLNCRGGGFTGDLVNKGLLTGTGLIMGNFTNAGTVSPGNSPGTLSVVGSFTQTASGTYLAEVASSSNYDKIAVTGAPGTATLAGTVVPTLLGGYRPLGSTLFPGVLTATGGITGTFSPILNQQISPTLFWQPRYRATSFDLFIQRDYNNASLGLNPNQQAVGVMLNGLAGATSGDLNTVLNAIDSLPASANVQDAFKQISPEKAGALPSLGFVAATFQVRNLATRTTNLRFVQGESGQNSGLTSGGLNFNYSKLDGMMLAYNGASLSNLFSARKEFKAPGSRWGLFADGGTAFGSQTSSLNQTGYNFSLGGLTIGADYRLRNNLLVGLATGYSNTSSGFNGSGGSITANTIPFNAYAAYFPGSLYAYGSVGYALNLYDLKRELNFGGLARTASSSSAGNQFNLYGETGYDLRMGRFILTPSATLAYSALWVGGFTEQGAGALNLKVASQAAASLQTGLGGRLTVPLRVGSIKVVPQGHAFYQHEFSNGSRGLNASLSQGSSTFNFQTDAAKRNYALVGASVTVGLKKNLYAQVNYNAEVGRGNSTVQYVNAGLRYEF